MMGVLLTDDREDQPIQPIVIGAIEFLPTGGFVPQKTNAANVRSIARRAIESRVAQRSEKQIAETAVRPQLQFPKPTLPTKLPCSLCFNDSRFGRSALCLRCINAKAASELRVSPLLDHELTVREYLGLCALVGLLLFCVCWFDAQPGDAPTHSTVSASARK